MQRRRVRVRIARHGTRIGPAIQQQFGQAMMAKKRGEMQRRPAVRAIAADGRRVRVKQPLGPQSREICNSLLPGIDPG
jgi:hypothetical protein